MNITPYEQLKVTTMTLVMSLSSGINIDMAFQLLPITRIAIKQTRESSKCKLPHCKTPGSILSMRYRGNIRGVIKNTSDPFKNAVTIDISTSLKNISAKLSSFSIQMCGASSKEDGIEAATHIIKHLKHVQKMLHLIQSDIDLAKETINFVKSITLGEEVIRSYSEDVQSLNEQEETMSDGSQPTLIIKIHKQKMEKSVTKPNIFIAPSKFDKELISFLLSLSDDFLYHNDYCNKLDFLINIKEIIDEPLELQSVDEAMVNYNYSLGYEVNRTILDELIDNKNGFVSRYNNALSTSVTIELPYEPTNTSSIKRRKNKIPHHTFLVYKSGSVTQSGPNSDLMKDAYYLFMETINELKPYIQYTQESLNDVNSNTF